MGKELNTESLTIFLIKKGIVDLKEIIPQHAQLEQQEVQLTTKLSGTLFYTSSKPLPPRWVRRFFKDYASELNLKVTSVSAVLLVNLKQRTFAVTFGQGRHLLEPDAYEERFGLHATLNSIDPDKLRTVDKETFEANPLRSRSQASKASTIAEFGVNIDQDIVRAVCGAPKDKDLGSIMAGRDALSVRVAVDLATLADKLRAYLAKSEESGYKRDFGWIDNISEVRNATEVNNLDDLLIAQLNQKSRVGVWLAIPALIDWMDFGGFRYLSPTTGIEDDDVAIEMFLISAKEYLPVNIEFLKKHKIYWIDSTGNSVKEQWSIYKCINAEVTKDSSTFILTNGAWYKIDKDYLKELNGDLKEIEESTFVLPNWGDETEAIYNSRVKTELGSDVALMDQELIHLKGETGGIEFCDLFFKDKKIIHVKRYGGSSVLSHLFWQATVSAELFISEERFRKALNPLLPETHKLADVQKRPEPSEYEIVFAIGSEIPGVLRLPFFSKISFRNTYRRLKDGLAFSVSYQKINIVKDL